MAAFPSQCSCGIPFGVINVMKSKKGSFGCMRHDEEQVRAKMLEEINQYERRGKTDLSGADWPKKGQDDGSLR